MEKYLLKNIDFSGGILCGDSTLHSLKLDSSLGKLRIETEHSRLVHIIGFLKFYGLAGQAREIENWKNSSKRTTIEMDNITSKENNVRNLFREKVNKFSQQPTKKRAEFLLFFGLMVLIPESLTKILKIKCSPYTENLVGLASPTVIHSQLSDFILSLHIYMTDGRCNGRVCWLVPPKASAFSKRIRKNYGNAAVSKLQRLKSDELSLFGHRLLCEDFDRIEAAIRDIKEPKYPSKVSKKGSF